MWRQRVRHPFVLGAVVIAIAGASWWSVRALLAEVEYQRWLEGQGQYSSELFDRWLGDSAWMYGRSVEDFRRILPQFVDGDTFSEGSYRKSSMNGYRYSASPQVAGKMKFYWLDANAEQFGQCFIFINGRFDSWHIVKG